MYLCRYKDTSETCYYAVFELNGCELYVESFTADESGSTMSWFNADGLHYGVDGYAVFNRELCKALGIEHVSSNNGRGDVTAEGAPPFILDKFIRTK